MYSNIINHIAMYNPDALYFHGSYKCTQHIFTFYHLVHFIHTKHYMAVQYILKHIILSPFEYDAIYEDAIYTGDVEIVRICSSYVNINSKHNLQCFLLAVQHYFVPIIYYLMDQNINLWSIRHKITDHLIIHMDSTLLTLILNYIMSQ